MKIKSYRTLYRIFSFLSDKTNGASLFVKYKLALGIILVGLTTVSCDKEEEEDPPLMCYDPVVATHHDIPESNVEILNMTEKEITSVTEIPEKN